VQNESDDQHKRVTDESTDNGPDSFEKHPHWFPLTVVLPLLLLLIGNTQFNGGPQHGPVATFALRTCLKIAAHKGTCKQHQTPQLGERKARQVKNRNREPCPQIQSNECAVNPD
jgi:hypothetical protein